MKWEAKDEACMLLISGDLMREVGHAYDPANDILHLPVSGIEVDEEARTITLMFNSEHIDKHYAERDARRAKYATMSSEEREADWQRAMAEWGIPVRAVVATERPICQRHDKVPSGPVITVDMTEEEQAAAEEANRNARRRDMFAVYG